MKKAIRKTNFKSPVLRILSISLTILILLLLLTSCSNKSTLNHLDGNYNDTSSYGQTNNKTDDSVEIETTLTDEIKKITVTEIFNDYIIFEKEGNVYSGAMNSQGEIFFYIEGRGMNWSFAGNDSGGYIYRDNGCEIIDKNGCVIASTQNGDFDEIWGVGDGFILVYKNTGNASKEEHSYGVIDCNTGSWKTPMNSVSHKFSKHDYALYQYIGNGVFLQNYYSSGYHCTLYNSTTNQIIEIKNMYESVSGNNGIICVKGKNSWGSTEAYINNIKYTSLPSYFAVFPDGNITEIDPFIISYGKITAETDPDETYYIFKNILTNQSMLYDDFDRTKVSVKNVQNGNILLNIHGADNRWYFTVVDITGYQYFEPITSERRDFGIGGMECDATIFSDRIIYKKINETAYTMIDIRGNVIIHEDKQYRSMTFLDNGLILAKDQNENNYLLNVNGSLLDITLK